MVFHVIGIGNRKYEPAQQVQDFIRTHLVFSGGRRQFELVRHLLPEGHQWIFVKVPLEDMFSLYEEQNESIVVFASGDPLFYGIAGTLKAKYPKAELYTYPYLSAIQLLVRRSRINSSKLQTVSVHGRSWAALDEVLIKQEELIGVLTDTNKSPAQIAWRLLEYGYNNYTIWIGEDLEGEDERVREMKLEEACQQSFHPLNLVILQKVSHRSIPFGLDDSMFAGLEGRPNMITKMPVRLCTLHALELNSASVLWDIGFCTGSLSIEARLRFPRLEVHAFERRQECMDLLHSNARSLGAPGIHAYTGDIFEADMSALPSPQAVFIGGHGSRLPELIQLLNLHLDAGTVIVMNAVQESSVHEFYTASEEADWKAAASMKISVDAHNEIIIMKAIK